jgi:hypothetical protein
MYRLDCLSMQVEWLFRQINENDTISNLILKQNIKVSALFDNIVFNAVSLFDYLLILVNFVCTNQKDKRIDWISLRKLALDKNNSFSKSIIADSIIQVNRELLERLYDYRSFVIHRSSDHGSRNFPISYGAGCQIARNMYYSSRKFVTSFSELRELNKDFSISLMYGSFWLVNKCLECVSRILLILKRFMEENKLVVKPTIFLKTKDDSDDKLPISAMYWNLDRDFDFNLC